MSRRRDTLSYIITASRRRPRGEEAWRSCSQAINAVSVNVGSYTEFECLAVKLVGRRARSVRVACIYKPPGAVSSAFTDQLCPLLDQLVLLNSRFVVVDDFNTPGDIAGQINQHVVDVFTQYGLHQHVNVPTHVRGNVLDLIVSDD